MHRLFMDPQKLSQNEIHFEGEPFQHLFRACRVQVNEKVGVLDGQGQMAIVEITRIEKNQAWGRKLSTEPLYSELPLQVDLAQAIGKKDKFDEVVDKATQLGVSRIIPLLTARTVVKAEKWDSKIKRWQKIALEAAQQSGRARVPECLAPVSVPGIQKSDYDGIFILNQKGASPQLFQKEYKRLLILVGPEGDFTQTEISQLESLGGQSVSLGPRTYRTEVAGLVALSLLNFFNQV